MNRRELLVGLAACGACKGGDTGPRGVCTAPSAGSDALYCLVGAVKVLVPGGADLQAGEAILANVDDNTAVILARDDAGLYARSGICTHACCVVALCTDASCAALTSSPAACEATDIVRPDPASGVFCPCHGSTFRLSDGAALTEPARTPLPAYAVTVDGSDAWVDTGVLVEASVRS